MVQPTSCPAPAPGCARCWRGPRPRASGGDEHAPLPRRHLLVGVEGECAGLPRAPAGRPSAQSAAERLGSRPRARRCPRSAAIRSIGSIGRRPAEDVDREQAGRRVPDLRLDRRRGRSSVWAGSTSQNTGLASSKSRQLEEATKLSGVVRTSSPLPHPSARTARCNAAVPLETATASGTPSQAAKSASKRGSIGPSESIPERSTSRTSSSSRSPSTGRASGRSGAVNSAAAAGRPRRRRAAGRRTRATPRAPPRKPR